MMPLWLYARDKTWIREMQSAFAEEVELHLTSEGKIFYLAFASLKMSGDLGEYSSGAIIVRDSDGILIGNIIHRTLETAVGAVGGEIAFPLPLPVPAGWSILVKATGGSTATGTIWGWEE